MLRSGMSPLCCACTNAGADTINARAHTAGDRNRPPDLVSILASRVAGQSGGASKTHFEPGPPTWTNRCRSIGKTATRTEVKMANLAYWHDSHNLGLLGIMRIILAVSVLRAERIVE